MGALSLSLILNFSTSLLQISELCTVAPVLSSSESSNNQSGEDPASADSTSNKNSDSNSNNGDNLKDLSSVTIKSSQSVNELICLDESTSSISQTDFGGITLDNFTLDDLNDDDFNPRAVDSQQKQQQQTPSTLVQVLTANEPTTPTSLLVPPPALPPREFKKISPVPENNNNPFR